MALTNKQKTGWVAIAMTCVACFEGVRQTSYLDPVSIPTICFGETKGVKIGQHATMEECKAMLASSLEIANKAVDRCIKRDIPDERRAALVSFAYNVGAENLCHSTLAKKLNAGDIAGGCDEFLRWDFAKGTRLPGLTRRRRAERELCLKGLP